MRIMYKVKNLAKGLKLPLYFTSFAPVMIAWFYMRFSDPFIFVMLVIVVVSMQAALNLAMDFTDHENGRRLRNEDTLFPIGSYLIESMRVKEKSVKAFFLLSLLISLVAGISIVVITGKYILLLFGVLAVIISLMYALPPFRLNSRGIGEVSTFFSFGPISLLGSIVALSGSLNLQLVLISILLGLLASAIRYLHHLPEDLSYGNRVRYFKPAYTAILIAGFIINAAYPYTFLFLLPPLAISIAHLLTLKKNVLNISRQTNVIVAIQIITSLLLAIRFIL